MRIASARARKHETTLRPSIRSRKIARSVRGLVAPALALGAGKAIETPAFNLREADEVGAALAQAQAMLRQAQYQANHDVLTGLANRALLIEIHDQQLVLCERNHGHLAVLYIDLDGFKKVNDENGHAVGDKLLQAVAERFTAAIRKSDVAARFGGDEFAVVLVDTAGGAAAAVAAKLLESLSAPYRIDRLTLGISASIGVAAYPRSGASSKILPHRADDAMYEAKAMGKRRVVVADNRHLLRRRPSPDRIVVLPRLPLAAPASPSCFACRARFLSGAYLFRVKNPIPAIMD